MKKFDSLTATVKHGRGYGKVRTVSYITIKLGPVRVAQATLGGKYSPEQAISDFKRLPHRFSKLSGYEAATQLGLVA